MTDRQLDYRNARQAANTAAALAANKASASLNNNGSSLANIAIKFGMNSDTATFGQADVDALRKIVDDLNGTGGVLDQIETAYIQYILAYSASASTGDADTVWQAVKGAVTAPGANLDSVLAVIGSAVPAEVMTGIEKYRTAVAQVALSDSKLDAMETTLESNPDATFTWPQLREAMEPLANPSAMKINGFNVSEVKQKLGDLAVFLIGLLAGFGMVA
jgi:hypothetical protein